MVSKVLDIFFINGDEATFTQAGKWVSEYLEHSTPLQHTLLYLLAIIFIYLVFFGTVKERLTVKGLLLFIGVTIPISLFYVLPHSKFSMSILFLPTLQLPRVIIFLALLIGTLYVGISHFRTLRGTLVAPQRTALLSGYILLVIYLSLPFLSMHLLSSI